MTKFMLCLVLAVGFEVRAEAHLLEPTPMVSAKVPSLTPAAMLLTVGTALQIGGGAAIVAPALLGTASIGLGWGLVALFAVIMPGVVVGLIGAVMLVHAFDVRRHLARQALVLDDRPPVGVTVAVF